MKYLIFLVSLFPFVSHALPEILDYYPECSAEPAETMNFSAKTMVDRQMLRLIDEPGFQGVLQALREKAHNLGADAISIEKLTMNQQLKDSSLRDKKVPLTLEFKTKLFRFCQENKALSQQRTPFNSDGERIVSADKTITATQITLSMPAKPQTVATPFTPGQVNSLVSLDHGVAGVKPGMSADDVTTILGTPSAVFYLAHEGQLWSYGRTLWLKFGQNLDWIANQQTLLSQEAVNRIGFSDLFDHSNWFLADSIPLKTDQSSAQPVLSQGFRQISTDRWQQQKAGLVFTLGFEPYVNKTNENSTLRWRDFSLGNAEKQELRLSMTEPARLIQWLAQLQQNPDPTTISLNSLTEAPLHQLNAGNSDTWLMAGEQLLLQYNDERLNRLVISPGLLRHGSDQTAQLLAALQLPVQKQDYLQRFPQAFDQGDKLSIDLHDRSMDVLFDGDDPAATAVQLELILH